MTYEVMYTCYEVLGQVRGKLIERLWIKENKRMMLDIIE